MEDSQAELDFTPGPALQNIGIDVLFAQDAVFTLTDLDFDDDGDGFNNGEDSMSGFAANSAFTATGFVPSPGAIALLGLTGLAAVRRRRA